VDSNESWFVGFGVHLLAPTLIILAPLIVFLDFHGHPFTNPEVLCVIFVMILVSGLFGLMYRRFGVFGKVLLFTLLLEFSLDLIGNFEITGKIVCAISAFIFLWLVKEKAPKIIAFTFSIFILVTLIFPSDRFSPILKEYKQKTEEKSLPTVVHIILDGHSGIEGLPREMVEGNKLKNDLIAFYNKNNFQLYGNAYSHYSITLNSIPSVFNFDTDIKLDKSYANEVTTDIEYELVENDYFKKMSELGYKIKVYQSKYLDYCQKIFRIASCYTYPIFSTHFLESISSSILTKAWVILNAHLMRSDYFWETKNSYWHLTKFVRQKFGLNLPFPWSWDGHRTSPIAASQALTTLTKDVQDSPSGTMFFAHLIAPHSPFVYDSNCQINNDPISEWAVSVDPTSHHMQNSISSREKRYKKYFQQVKCVSNQLQELFDTMRRSNIFEEAVIIIHGDHGSRIRLRRPTLANQDEITSMDLLDSFSALFAVKIPNVKGEYDTRTLSLNQAFSLVAEKMFKVDSIQENRPPYINLRVRNSKEKKKRSFVKFPYAVMKK
jgi:hypothetical protein